MVENLYEITVDTLLNEAQKMMFDNYRFVTATCVDNGGGNFEVTYHFDKDLELKNYRIKVQKGEEVPSISKIYFCALLVENEMKELFGLNVTNIAIDYGGHLLLSDDELEAPMARPQIVIEQKGAKKDV
ncbi:MAG: NADH-quinone oxidoreductase subunit C [Clostridia bacterium]|nr:NADH-quinone oxidoreductase subunit C [Clostridia bacterium]